MGRIPEEDIEKVRDATDVVQVVGETVMLKQKGRLWWGLCPFHNEKTPSFKVDPSTGLWHCFGCGEGGDVFGFLMKRESLEFPDAVRELADVANIELHETGGAVPKSERDRLVEVCEAAVAFYHGVLTTSRDPRAQEARTYLAERGFGIDVAKRFELGFAPDARAALTQTLTKRGFTRKELLDANLSLETDGGRLKDRFFGRVMFPIRDLRGRAVAFGGRVVGEGEPKYLNSNETAVFHKSSTLYALDRAKNPIVTEGTAVVVEGYTDVIAMYEAGLRHAVATLGTALTAQHVKTLSRFADKVVYLFDGDEAGRRAAARAAEFLEWQATPEKRVGRVELLVAVVPEGMDPADYVARKGADDMHAVIEEAEPLLRFVLDRRLNAHDLATPEGRSRALADAAGVLAGLKGSLLGHDYAIFVADRLGVEYETVQGEMMRARPDVSLEDSPEEGTGSGEGGADAVTDPERRTEVEALRLVATCAGVRDEARVLLDEGLVRSPEIREAIRVVLEAGGAEGGALYERLRVSHPEAAKLVSGFLVEEEGIGTDECLAALRGIDDRLQEFGLRRQITRLRARLEEMDPEEDRADYDALFREIALLQRQMKAGGLVRPASDDPEDRYQRDTEGEEEDG